VSTASRLAVTRVLIVGNNRLTADGMARALQQCSGIEVTDTVLSIAAAMRLSHDHAPDIVVVDCCIPGCRDFIRSINAACGQAHVVVFALDAGDDGVLEWADAGIAGFVTGETSIEELADAIRDAGQGRFSCSATIAGRMLERLGTRTLRGHHSSGPALDRLTGREVEVLTLIGEGYSNKRIAGALGISIATVKHHVHSILRKLRVSRRGEAVARWSSRRGLQQRR
jgi:DNA-binding NarL/FixJ family response regulator